MRVLDDLVAPTMAALVLGLVWLAGSVQEDLESRTVYPPLDPALAQRAVETGRTYLASAGSQHSAANR